MRVEELRYYEGLLGRWEIRYPRPGGKTNRDYAEYLDLTSEGTFSWVPPPLWVKPGGHWGISGTPATGDLKLYFEERRGGTFRGQWLVVVQLWFGGQDELFMHWQRTVAGTVVFDDEIFVGRLVRRGDGGVSHLAQTLSTEDRL